MTHITVDKVFCPPLILLYILTRLYVCIFVLYALLSLSVLRIYNVLTQNRVFYHIMRYNTIV